jgi:hypothetical protein
MPLECERTAATSFYAQWIETIVERWKFFLSQHLFFHQFLIPFAYKLEAQAIADDWYWIKTYISLDKLHSFIEKWLINFIVRQFFFFHRRNFYSRSREPLIEYVPRVWMRGKQLRFKFTTIKRLKVILIEFHWLSDNFNTHCTSIIN